MTRIRGAMRRMFRRSITPLKVSVTSVIVYASIFVACYLARILGAHFFGQAFIDSGWLYGTLWSSGAFFGMMVRELMLIMYSEKVSVETND